MKMKKLIFIMSLVGIILSACILSTPASAASKPSPGIVYTQGTKFVVDGYPFYYAGCNSYDLFTKSQAEIDKRMSDMAADGIKVVRTWGFSHETWHGFEPTKGVYSEEQFKLFDYVMKSAKEHGIKVIITLENYWEAYGGIDTRLKWEGLPSGTHAARAKFYTDPGCIEGYKNYVEHFVTRTNYYTGVPYSEDPTVFSWELMNEPRYQDAGENSTGTTLRKWTDEMGAFIKNLDPKHMVSAGIEGHESKYGFGGDEGNPFVYIQQSPYIDFCTAHPYPDESWANLTSAQAAALVNAWIDDAHNVVGKPFVLEEFNTHSNKEEYWTAMFKVMEDRDAAGDNFWNFNDRNTSNFDLLQGDPLFESVFKPHAQVMAAKNNVPVHKPLGFNQLSPANESTGILPGAVFKWEPAIGASNYNIVVSDNINFTNPLINATLNKTEYTPEKDLDFNTRYYWKVTATNSLGSTDALNSGIYFTTRPAPVSKPGEFNQLSPENNFIGTGLRPTFTWSNSIEALSYNLIISKNSDFSSPVISETRLPVATYTPEVDLELGVKYYWKVSAVNSVGNTPAANSGTCFTTINLPPVYATVKVQAMLNTNSDNETQYKLVVCNTGGGAIDNFSARVYLDLSEVFDAGYTNKDIIATKLFDQSNGKTTLSGPIEWDAENNTYYIEVNWNGYVLNENSTIEQDISIRLSNWQPHFNSSNDFSFTGLGKSFIDTEYIPVYHGNLRMWGKDPAKGSSPIYGDVNGDGAVDALDFAVMKSYLLGIINDLPVENDIEIGDLNGDNSIDSIDFALMKQFLLGTITEFPK
jgi:mannan endo-1,4-beta-mannosidase